MDMKIFNPLTPKSRVLPVLITKLQVMYEINGTKIVAF